MKYISILKSFFVACGLGFVFLYGMFFLRSSNAIDFFQFWLVGQSIHVTHLDNIYSEVDQIKARDILIQKYTNAATGNHFRRVAKFRQKLELAATPFFYSVFSLLSSGSFEADYIRFQLFSLTCYIAAIWMLSRMCGLDAVSSVLVLFFFIFLFNPAKVDMTCGNVSQIQLAWLTAILWMTNREENVFVAGFVGVLIATFVFFKPNVIFIVPIWMVIQFLQSSRKILLASIFGLVLGAGLSVLLPGLLFGKAITFPKWFFAFSQIGAMPFYLSRSFLGTMFGVNSYFGQGIVGCMVMALIFLCMSHNKKYLKNFGMGKFYLLSIGVCASLLISPMVHRYYFVLLLPIMVVLFHDLFLNLTSVPAWKRIIFISAITFLCSPTLTVLPAGCYATPDRWDYFGILGLFFLGISELNFKTQLVRKELG